VSDSTFAAAFLQRLNELGWIEGRTVEIVFRWSEHRAERHGVLVADLVRLKVDVIVTSNIDYPYCVRARGRPGR